MSSAILSIPNDPAEWPNWLERQLVGPRLRDLVRELQLIVPEGGEAAPTLENVLGEQAPAVLERGLGVLAEQQVRLLLQHPRLLLDLQERVLVAGGEYWQTAILGDSQDAVARQWDAIETALDADSHVSVVPFQKPDVGRRSKFRTVVALCAVAATLLIALGVWTTRPATPSWGFERSGLLTAQVPPDQYLQSLADAAGDWFNKTPETRIDLERRLREFRHGCDTLIAAPHPQLVAADREWLVERCRKWADKLDGHLADLAVGAKEFAVVRREADETINSLISALEERSQQLAS
ncbi:MAG: hypothetical protein O3C40_29165 [Planctomycetota bacterium]|nr:hypothetical protein [Planctomycetota bacterium]